MYLEQSAHNTVVRGPNDIATILPSYPIDNTNYRLQAYALHVTPMLRTKPNLSVTRPNVGAPFPGLNLPCAHIYCEECSGHTLQYGSPGNTAIRHYRH